MPSGLGYGPCCVGIKLTKNWSELHQVRRNFIRNLSTSAIYLWNAYLPTFTIAATYIHNPVTNIHYCSYLHSLLQLPTFTVAATYIHHCSYLYSLLQLHIFTIAATYIHYCSSATYIHYCSYLHSQSSDLHSLQQLPRLFLFIDKISGNRNRSYKDILAQTKAKINFMHSDWLKKLKSQSLRSKFVQRPYFGKGKQSNRPIGQRFNTFF